MKLLILDPSQFSNKAYLIRALVSQGHQVFAIGQVAYEQLSWEVRRDLIEYYRVDDINDLDRLKRATAFFLYKYGKMDQVYAFSDRYKDTISQLRKEFHFPSLELGQVVQFEDSISAKLVSDQYSAFVLFDPQGQVLGQWIFQDLEEGLYLEGKLGFSQETIAALSSYQAGPIVQVFGRVKNKRVLEIEELSHDLASPLVLELINYVQGLDTYRLIAEAFWPSSQPFTHVHQQGRSGYLVNCGLEPGQGILRSWREENGQTYGICLVEENECM